MLTANAEELLISVSDETDISVTRYTLKDAKAVVLWIPSEFGIRGREKATALALNKMGYEVWLADLHSSYFIPHGRNSYKKIPTQDIKKLIVKAADNPHKEVVLFATGRAAALSLKAVRKLQLKPDTNSLVKSAILFHPNFYAGSTQAGNDIQYLPITYATNLALYIVQPSLSGKHFQLKTLEKHLQTGGSDVILQTLNGVSDGFNIRKPENKTEESFYQKTPVIINNAIRFLNLYKKTRTVKPLPSLSNTNSRHKKAAGLQPYQGNIKSLHIDFNDLKNNRHTLKSHQGEVLLINFWASWCPPCVKELPSLNRLQSKIGTKDFNILAVNIGEETATVRKFLAPMSIQFPVLTDPEGESVKPWKLIAFPSSFIVDKKGVIRYSLFGAIEWDNMEVTGIIQKLLLE